MWKVCEGAVVCCVCVCVCARARVQLPACARTNDLPLQTTRDFGLEITLRRGSANQGKERVRSGSEWRELFEHFFITGEI